MNRLEFQKQMSASSLQLGRVTLFLPNASDPDFWFGHDIAGMLGHETNATALSVLLKSVRQDTHRPRGRLSFDREADAVWFQARQPDPVIHAIQVLHRLAGLELTADEVAFAVATARAWRRPKPQKWRVGDLFSVPLSDSTLAFGQVVGSHMTGPTLLLFEGRASSPMPVAAILALRFITVLHTFSSCLDSGEFAVLGHADPCVDPASGPWGKGDTSTCDATLKDLANAWYGLEPWNVLVREDEWDKHLYPGVSRPSSAIVLSVKERVEYRRQRWGVQE